MSEAQPVPLALPPPRAIAPAVTGLRASLRGAAAMPVDPVQPSRPALDAAFGTSVQTIGRERSSGSSAGDFQYGPSRQVDAAYEWIQSRFFVDQSIPFLAQQIGQNARLVVPTLDATAEVAAYAAAQQRADRAALGQEALLDVRA